VCSPLLRYAYSFSRRSYERSEVEFRYNIKTTQENLYQKLLKLIRENPLKFNLAKDINGIENFLAAACFITTSWKATGVAKQSLGCYSNTVKLISETTTINKRSYKQQDEVVAKNTFKLN